MRIRTAKFVMIPMWVMTHPDVRGNATRIATYAGLRAVAWEAPETDWRSMREVARAVCDVNGLGEEAVRKHLAVLARIGAMVRRDDDLLIPDDDPGLGMAVGTQVPNVGYLGTQTADHTLFLQEREERAPVGTTGAPRKADRNREHPDFAEFWAAYPRKKDRPAAIRAFNDAIASTSLQVILDGLSREILGWNAARRPTTKIPYPATWLNSQGWTNEPDVGDRPATREARAVEAAAVQRSEVDREIAAGRHETAWRMLIEKAATRTETAWWPEAERIHHRPDRVIAMTVGVDVDTVTGWRAFRDACLAGQWPGMSHAVGELPS